jgi:multiple sugar transport system substrate-binding protein
MSKQFNRAMLFILLSALLLLAAGTLIRLGPGANTAGERPTASPRRAHIALVFTQWWEHELEPYTLQSLIEEFEKENPGISINLNTCSYSELESMSQNASPLESDLYGIDPQWFYELVRNERLEPLETYRAAAPPESGMFSFTDADQQYNAWGVPLLSFTAPFFYNITVLRRAGFDRPPKTWSELFAYAKAVSSPNERRFGLGLALNPDYPQGIMLDVYSWIWANGGVLVRDGKPGFIERNAVEALEFLNSLQANGLLAPDSFSRTREQKREEFINGAAGFMIAPAQEIEVLRSRLGEEGFGLTALPAADPYTGKPAIGLSRWYACISSASRYKNEAWAFLSFLSARAERLAEAAHAVPGAGIYPREDPFYAKAFDIYENAEPADELIGLPQIHTLETIVWEEIKNMLEGHQDAPRTARTIQARWESITAPLF